uniref:Ig-like domain-containing protein n=1 Tax=Amphiprion ocellaris TaxID=80972 RepID=A0AAQ5ZHU5_AMPOC
MLIFSNGSGLILLTFTDTKNLSGLSVWIHPAEVTEGQTVTLTCSTSCPLSGNYTWTFNSKPLSQNKHLVLDPVSIQHAGNYSCAVRNGRIISSEKTLTVQRAAGTFVAAAGVGAAFLIITLLVKIHGWKWRELKDNQRSQTPNVNLFYKKIKN